MQHQLRHVRLRPRRRCEAEQGIRLVAGRSGHLHLGGKRVADETVDLRRQRGHGGAGVDDRPAGPVPQRESGLRHRQPRRPDGDALQREVVESWSSRVLDEWGGLHGARGVAVELGRQAEQDGAGFRSGYGGEAVGEVVHFELRR